MLNKEYKGFTQVLYAQVISASLHSEMTLKFKRNNWIPIQSMYEIPRQLNNILQNSETTINRN